MDNEHKDGSGSGSDSSEPEFPIVRTSNCWYHDAYVALTKFACMLKGKELEGITVPFPLAADVCEYIGKIHISVHGGKERVNDAREASNYILKTLDERMKQFGLKPTNDHYMNVINYFRTLKGDEFLKELMNAEDKRLIADILPWLGLTDWGSNSAGRNKQLTMFKYKLEKYLKGSKRRSLEPESASKLLASSEIQSDTPVRAPAAPDYEAVRRARMQFFKLQPTSKQLEHDKKGGKRATTKKPRRVRKCKTVKKSKRRCKK